MKKILFIGDTNVGKTTIIKRLIKDEIKTYNITLGINFYKYKEYTLIDTGEFYLNQNIINTILPKVHYIFIVYDLTDMSTYHYAKKLYNKFKKDYTVKLLPNKADLVKEIKVEKQRSCCFRC